MDPSGKGTYVASLFTENDKDDMVYFAYQMHMTDDDVIILNGVYGRELYLTESNTWLVGFKLQDLIKGSQTSSSEIVVEEDKTLIVYPNPSSGIFKIQSESEIKAVTVIAPNGVEIIKNIQKSEELNISHLPNGIYLLVLYNTNGKVTRKMVVKQ